MSPLLHRGTPETPFTQQIADFEAFIAETPVPRDDVLDKLEALDTLGQQMVGAGEQKPLDLAKAMQPVFGKIVELEVEPPFTKEQSDQLKGRYAIFAAAADIAKPKRGRRSSKPTDTSKIPTDNRK